MSITYGRLAVVTRPPDGVLLAPSVLAAPRLVTRAVTIRRPDGVS